ncbi:MAG: ABC-F family ATP-binding cassette domain-containing protein [Candidatus Cloacimonetes bacterium]|nr:ABC-F family ATP-binding cassette domain-containing protein [Candidatus Cloacimonadota bacterium]
MSIIQCVDLGIEFGGNYVLRNVNCTIEHNSRIGLIGPNGSGKTTLIKLILGELRPVEGQVLKAKNYRIAYLAQNTILNPQFSMLEYIESARTDIRDLRLCMKDLSAKLSKSHDEKIQKELNTVLEKMHQCGAFEHENEIKYVLSSLGFQESDLQRCLADFSGGEQTRICLAYILLAEYELLIMDEPTNHLDIAMTRWLERYLSSHERPYLVVSHDRVFLDNVCRSIYHLGNGTLSITKGNYSSWFESHQIELKSLKRQYERQQKLIAQTQDFIRRNMGSQKTSQARSRLKMLDRIEKVQMPHQDKQIQLGLSNASRSGNDVFLLKDATIGINSQLVLARKVNIEAHWQDRIALIGPNGCGKSTLLRVLLGQHEILAGKFKGGASLKIGYYDQHQNLLDGNKTVLDTLWSIVPEAPRGYVLSWLARFAFTADDVEKRVSVLSGGEKSRLYLSVLIHQAPNLLILDEPTNHLDIAMRDSLLEALEDFKGTVIFVSHDRHFISSLARKYWVFRKIVENNEIINTIQDLELSTEDAIELAFSEPEITKQTESSRERKRKINPWHLQQIQNEIDDKQTELIIQNQRREVIHKLLAESETYTNLARVRDLNEENQSLEDSINQLVAEISSLEDRYLELACDE